MNAKEKELGEGLAIQKLRSYFEVYMTQKLGLSPAQANREQMFHLAPKTSSISYTSSFIEKYWEAYLMGVEGSYAERKVRKVMSDLVDTSLNLTRVEFRIDTSIYEQYEKAAGVFGIIPAAYIREVLSNMNPNFLQTQVENKELKKRIADLEDLLRSK